MCRRAVNGVGTRLRMTYQRFIVQKWKGQVSHMPFSTLPAPRRADSTAWTVGDPTMAWAPLTTPNLRRRAPIPRVWHHSWPLASRSTSKPSPSKTSAASMEGRRNAGFRLTLYWLTTPPSKRLPQNSTVVRVYEQRTLANKLFVGRASGRFVSVVMS